MIAISEFGCKDSSVKVINVKESPKVKFSFDAPCSLTPTVFTNETSDVNATIANYSWEFSDGFNTAAKSPTHLFASIGPKTVKLKVNLDNGCKSELTKDLVVGVQPKAEFSAADVCAGSPVVFENKTTWEQGEITYDWDFGNGTFSTERAPRKEYVVPVTTTYTVALKATIAGGCSDQVIKQITINEAPKTCNFDFAPDYASAHYGMKMQTVDNNGNPSAQPGVTYTWVIETGGNKKGSTVVHDFRKDGTYEVTMVARVDATGCECSKTNTVVMNRTEVEEFENAGISVFPNPNSGMFNIALTENFGDNVTIEVMSVSGAVVKTLTTTNSGLVTVDAGDVADGMYLVRVRSGKRVSTSRINIRR
jgi:Secretion system C-terminal sorting domain/PKD domain